VLETFEQTQRTLGKKKMGWGDGWRTSSKSPGIAKGFWQIGKKSRYMDVTGKIVLWFRAEKKPKDVEGVGGKVGVLLWVAGGAEKAQ